MNTTCPCCTAPMNGSDHCPECGCEEYESYCEMGDFNRVADATARAFEPRCCDGNGQVTVDTGVLSYVRACTDQDCKARRAAAWDN